MLSGICGHVYLYVLFVQDIMDASVEGQQATGFLFSGGEKHLGVVLYPIFFPFFFFFS